VNEQLLLKKIENGICTLTINRPRKANSLNVEMLKEIILIMKELQDEQNVRVVVIRGAGSKAFCAGLDVGQIPASKTAGEDNVQGVFEKSLAAVRELPLPAIAMINGFCVGAGLELAVNCDIRIASETAKLGITPAKLGLIYHPEGLKRFIALIGPSATKELFLTGRLITAQKAGRTGLVNEVAPDEHLEEIVYKLAGEIAVNAPLSVRGHKYIINSMTDKMFDLGGDEKDKINQMIARAFNSEDFLEGKRAFLENRKPEFKGK
jgi:enoyl-CoA hydratase/carnithine racemase